MKKRIALASALVLGLLAAVAWFATPRVPDGPLEAQLSWLVDDASARQAFSGVVLLTRSDSTMFARAIGVADSVQARPMRVDTPFPLASLSKPFTALLVLQLVQEGRLTLAQPLSQILPTLIGTDAGAITIHQLLSHSSGIEEVISRDPNRRISPADLQSARVTPTTFAYSNTGFVCLVLVLEALTGQRYEDILRARILETADMRASGVLRANSPVAAMALGDGVRAPTDIGAAPEALDGAGTIFSNALDLVHFRRALMSDVLLGDASKTLMMQPQSDGYGYGWMLSEQDGRSYVWHSGTLPGYSNYLAIIPAREEILVVLSNRSNADVRSLARRLLRVSKQHP